MYHSCLQNAAFAENSLRLKEFTYSACLQNGMMTQDEDLLLKKHCREQKMALRWICLLLLSFFLLTMIRVKEIFFAFFLSRPLRLVYVSEKKTLFYMNMK